MTQFTCGERHQELQWCVVWSHSYLRRKVVCEGASACAPGQTQPEANTSAVPVRTRASQEERLTSRGERCTDSCLGRRNSSERATLLLLVQRHSRIEVEGWHSLKCSISLFSTTCWKSLTMLLGKNERQRENMAPLNFCPVGLPKRPT